MYVPALAARDPAGATQVTTGTSAARILRMMSRMEASRPPGVFRRSTTSSTPVLLGAGDVAHDVVACGGADGVIHGQNVGPAPRVRILSENEACQDQKQDRQDAKSSKEVGVLVIVHSFHIRTLRQGFKAVEKFLGNQFACPKTCFS
jgi:hypothetical protein